MRVEALRHLGLGILSISTIAIMLALPVSASASVITIQSISGPDAVSIQPIVVTIGPAETRPQMCVELLRCTRDQYVR